MSRTRSTTPPDAGQPGAGQPGADQPDAGQPGADRPAGETAGAAAGLSTQPVPVAALGPAGTVRWLWRQLTSMRTALVLLFLLALASIPGSVFPQRGTDPLKVKDYLAAHPGWGGALDRLGMFDVFAAPWFAATYLLLFVSLVGCVLPRARQHWRALRAAPPAAPRRLARMPVYRGWEAGAGAGAADVPGAALDAAAAHLRARRWRVVDSRTAGGTAAGRSPAGGDPAAGAWVAAEKGYARETGNLLFHVALVGLLVSVAAGALLGWKGTVILKEGDGFSNALTQYDAWSGGRMVDPASLPPFTLALESFDAQFEREGSQRGAPRSFEATVRYRPDPSAEPSTAVVQVNEPLSVDGAKVFLLGHGYAPEIVVKDASGRVVFDDAVVFLPQDGDFTSTGVVKVYGSDPQLGLQGIFLPTMALDAELGPHSAFPAPDDPALFLAAWKGTINPSGAPQSVYRLDTAAMTKLGLEQLAVGQPWTLPGGAGTVEFTGFRRWASFQVSSDPGKLPALAFAGLALVGLMLSLFVRRRRVWVRVGADADGRTLLDVAGLSRTEAGGLDREVDDLAAAVRAAAPPVGAVDPSDPGPPEDPVRAGDTAPPAAPQPADAQPGPEPVPEPEEDTPCRPT